MLLPPYTCLLILSAQFLSLVIIHSIVCFPTPCHCSTSLLIAYVTLVCLLAVSLVAVLSTLVVKRCCVGSEILGVVWQCDAYYFGDLLHFCSKFWNINFPSILLYDVIFSKIMFVDPFKSCTNYVSSSFIMYFRQFTTCDQVHLHHIFELECSMPMITMILITMSIYFVFDILSYVFKFHHVNMLNKISYLDY